MLPLAQKERDSLRKCLKSYRKIVMTMHISKDPLHGVTLEMILNRLVEHFGWEKMGRLIKINCFNYDPSIKSSLTFLRRMPWARKKVEDLYVQMQTKYKKKE